MKVDVNFVEIWLMAKHGVMEGTEKYSEFLSFLDSSKLNRLRAIEGSNSPNRGTSFEKLGRFIYQKGDEV